MHILKSLKSIDRVFAFVLLSMGALACTSESGAGDAFDANGANSSEYQPEVFSFALRKHQCSDAQDVVRQLDVIVNYDPAKVSDPTDTGPIQVFFTKMDNSIWTILAEDALEGKNAQQAAYPMADIKLGSDYRRDFVTAMYPVHAGNTVEIKEAKDPTCADKQ